MNLEKRLLLIKMTGDCAWHEALSEAVASWGELQDGEYEEAMQKMMNNDYDLVIVDSLAVENMPQFVSTIRNRWPKTRVVVFTSSPTWRRARDAFYAGASDYIRKSYDSKELTAVLQAALQAQPSPWRYLEKED